MFTLTGRRESGLEEPNLGIDNSRSLYPDWVCNARYLTETLAGVLGVRV